MKRSKEEHLNQFRSGWQSGSQPNSFSKKKSKNTEILKYIGNKLLIFMWVHHLQHQNLFNKCICISLNWFTELKTRNRQSRSEGTMNVCRFPSECLTAPCCRLKINEIEIIETNDCIVIRVILFVCLNSGNLQLSAPMPMRAAHGG